MAHQEKDELKGLDLVSLEMVSDKKVGRMTARWMLGIMLLLIVCLFLPWQQNIRGYGVLTAYTPQDRPQTIETTIAGRIEKWYVKEGIYVKKGDTILVISEIKDDYFNPQLITRLKEEIAAKESSIVSLEDKVNALSRQIAANKQSLSLNMEQARNKLKIAKNKLSIDSIQLVAARVDAKIADTQLKRQDNLYKQGLRSLAELESRVLKNQEAAAKLIASENKYLLSRNELINAEIEINAKQAEYLDKISKAESDRNTALKDKFEASGDLAKKRNYLSNMEIRQGFYVIRAPQDGYVVKALKQGLGQTVKEREAVATIMPARSRLAVELYIKAMDVPLLKVGQHVRVQFDGWPAIQFSGWPNLSVGTFGGQVAVIDYIESEKSTYRVLVIQDPKDDPWPWQLRVGTGAFGWAMLNEVPIWYELWRQFNGFPPDMIDQFSKMSGSKAGSKEKGEEEKPKDKDKSK